MGYPWYVLTCTIAVFFAACAPLRANFQSLQAESNIANSFDFITPRSISLSNSGTFLVVADSGLMGVVGVDSKTGIRSYISSGTVGSGPLLISPNYAVLDSNDTFIYLVDSGLSAVVRVDRASGERLIISSNSVGLGPPFVNLNTITFSKDFTKLYVIDNGNGSLISVDPLTGDRTVISNGSLGSGPLLNFAYSISKTQNDLSVIVSDTNRIISIELSTGNRTIISGPANGMGPVPGVLTGSFVSKVTNSIYILDTFTDNRDNPTIMRVNPQSGERVLVTGDSVGNGPSLEVPEAMVIDSTESRAFVVDSSLDEVFEINLVTGARKVLSPAIGLK